MSLRVTTGASSDSPAATARMPSTSSSGRTSLSRNPLAPARRASTTYSSMSNVVSMRTRDRQPGSARMRRVASMPSTPGIRTSMSTMSGRVDATRLTASAPSSASPTTSRSGSVSRIIRRPRRTSAWSSAMRTVEPPDVVHAGAAVGSTATSSNPPSARGPRPQRPSVDRDALAHTDEPVPASGVDTHVGVAVTGDARPRLADAGPVIDDLEPHGVAVIGDHDRGVAGTVRVSQRVGQPLLKQPVRREVDAAGQLTGVAGDRDRHRQPGRAELLGQPVDLTESGRRLQARALAVGLA